MTDVPKWRRVLRFWRADVAADVDDELRFHFEARTEELRARGLAADEAQRIAAEEFGDVDAVRRGLREIGERVERRRERRWRWHQLASDVRYVLRGLRATPLFTVGVVLTLALGIGAAASMYGTMRRLLLDPPPHVAAPARVAKLYFRVSRAADSTVTVDRFSYPYYERLHDVAHTLAGVAAYDADVPLAVGSGPDARMVRATLVSGGFWRALGTRPALGRFFSDDEAHPATGARVVVLGHAFWRRRYDGDPAVLGTTLRVKGIPYQIVGVAPRGFRGVELTDTDVWLPMFAYADHEEPPGTHTRTLNPWYRVAGSYNLQFVVLPRPDVPAARVVADLERAYAVVTDDLERQLPPEVRDRARVSVVLGSVTGATRFDGRRMPEATVSVWLVGVAGVLLAIACANVASLLLLRALRRRREIAVRLALGMSRRRLAALLFVESAIVSLLGGLAAVAVVAVGGAWVRRVLLPDMLAEAPGVDWRTLGVATAVVVVTALLTGLAPVLQTRHDVAVGLRDGAQHGATRRSTLYWGLLVAQTALSAVLLVGAGLFVRSLDRVTSVDFGMDIEHATVVRIDFAGSGRSNREIAAFFERALERVRAIPGVAAAAVAVGAPLGSARGYSFAVRPNGQMIETGLGTPFLNSVSDGFFDATGMRLVRGSGIEASDRAGPPVVVLNEALAEVAWPGKSPLGECAYLSSAPDRCARVVGVVRNAHTWMVREPQRLWLYTPLDLSDAHDRALVVRASPGVRGMEGTIARALRELDPALPYVDARRLADVIAPQYRPWRLGATVFMAFGALAALLAALGLYTAVAYAVAQRTREIGVRVALGAAAPSIAALVFVDALGVAAVGVGVGLATALVASGRIADLLFDTSAHDPAVFAAVGALLLGVAGAASLSPARRALRVNPAVALRAD